MSRHLSDEAILGRFRREAAARAAAISSLEERLGDDGALYDRVVRVAKDAAKVEASVVERLRAELRTAVSAGTALVETERTARVESNSALAESITSLEASLTDLSSGVTGVSTAQELLRAKVEVVDGEVVATSERILTLESTVNNPATGLAATVARLTTEESTRASETSALATRATSLEATVNNSTTGVAAAHSRITTEESARASADSAISSRTTSLESSVSGLTSGLATANSRITTEENTRASADGALASRATALESTASGLTSDVSTLTSRIATEETTRANADSTLSSSITTLSSSVGSISATLTSEISTRASADGNLASKYTLKTEVIGSTGKRKITGMNLTSASGPGTDISDVVFTADRFRIYNSETDTDDAIFQVDTVNNVVRLSNSTRLQWASIDGTGRPADNADVTLAAVNGGLTITSGGITVRSNVGDTGQIQSGNYVAGSSGWALKADGSLEASNVTARGTVVAGSTSTLHAIVHSDPSYAAGLFLKYGSTPLTSIRSVSYDFGGATGVRRYGVMEMWTDGYTNSAIQFSPSFYDPYITLRDSNVVMKAWVDSSEGKFLFGTDTNHDVDLTRNGTRIGRITSTGLDITGVITATSAVYATTFIFQHDTDTYLSCPSPFDRLTFRAGGYDLVYFIEDTGGSPGNRLVLTNGTKLKFATDRQSAAGLSIQYYIEALDASNNVLKLAVLE